MTYKKRGSDTIHITEKERELGVKVKCFEAWELKDAQKYKSEWFAKREHLTILKEKTKVIHGRGAVVGKWKSSKVYVSFIPTKKLEALKQFRRERHEFYLKKSQEKKQKKSNSTAK